MKNFLTKSLLIGIALPLIAGCVERRVIYRQGPPPETTVVTEPANPPPPQVEVVPSQPDITFVWVPGAWEWHGHWVWVHGRWGPPPHHGAVWVRGGWVHHGHGYVWRGGHWR